MSIDISSSVALAGSAMTAPRPAVADSAAPPQPAAASVARPADATKSVAVAERVLRKADVGYSAEEVRRNLAEAVERLNDQMRENGRALAFRVDEKVDRTVITVRQRETGEVVRQIPSEQVLKVAHSIEDIKGLLFNEAI
jgi:flagellar protein FlaG